MSCSIVRWFFDQELKTKLIKESDKFLIYFRVFGIDSNIDMIIDHNFVSSYILGYFPKSNELIVLGIKTSIIEDIHTIKEYSDIELVLKYGRELTDEFILDYLSKKYNHNFKINEIID